MDSDPTTEAGKWSDSWAEPLEDVHVSSALGAVVGWPEVVTLVSLADDNDS